MINNDVNRNVTPSLAWLPLRQPIEFKTVYKALSAVPAFDHPTSLYPYKTEWSICHRCWTAWNSLMCCWTFTAGVPPVAEEAPVCWGLRQLVTVAFRAISKYSLLAYLYNAYFVFEERSK